MVYKTISTAYPWREDRLSWPLESETGSGLRGVVASATRVSWLDPVQGRLWYRGVPVEQLAGRLSFEEVAYLLITGKSPEHHPADARCFCNQLRQSRRLPVAVSALIREMDPAAHPTRLLRAGISAVGCHELAAGDSLDGDRHWRELRIVGQVAALVAEIARFRRRRPVSEPAETSSLAAGVLEALGEAQPRAEQIAALDLLWLLYADHGLDAPTFTSMIVASCLADPYYNIVAGLSALRGPRLGGASERVIDQLRPLHDPAEARAWAAEALGRGESIQGFGHRLYRRPDPRVTLLRHTACTLATHPQQSSLFEAAKAVEQEVEGPLAAKGIYVNINYYAALAFHFLGAEAAMIPCLFAVGRMAGLVARVREGLSDNRLYRPLSRYVGPARSAKQGGSEQ